MSVFELFTVLLAGYGLVCFLVSCWFVVSLMALCGNEYTKQFIKEDSGVNGGQREIEVRRLIVCRRRCFKAKRRCRL
jgi:hypothetical protein